jgi:hypothetical protein
MSDPLDQQTKDVADAYWGTGAGKPPVRDAHGVGDPPRELTEGMRRYILDNASTLFGLWVGAAVLASIIHAIAVAATGNVLLPPVFPVLFIALAVVSGRKRAGMRRRLTRVLTEGALVGAVVRNISQQQRGRYVMTTITYRVEGTDRDVFVSSGEQAITFLQVGLRDEVLFLPADPFLVVPTFLLA